MNTQLSALKGKLNELLRVLHMNALDDDDDVEFICCYVLKASCRLKLVIGSRKQCLLREEIIQLYSQVRQLQALVDDTAKELFDDYRYVWLDGALKILDVKSVAGFWVHFSTRFAPTCFGWTISADQTINCLSEKELIAKYRSVYPTWTTRVDWEIIEACYTPPHELSARLIQLIGETLRILTV